METKISNAFPAGLKFAPCNYGLRDMGDVGKALLRLIEEIGRSKMQLDSINVPDKESLLSVFNYLQEMRRDIANRIGDSRCRDNQKVNNSFLKGIEILAKYKIPERYERIVLLDTAAMPGHYVYAVNYYVRHILAAPRPLTWFGCYDERNQFQRDNFRIKQRCQKKWLATTDFTNLRTIDKIVAQSVKAEINLAISDLAIDTSENYDDQETAFMKAVVAQLIIDISSIGRGGSVILKQFSCFTPFAISYMYALSGMFEEFYVYKPVSSKPQNSEIFMVCIGFKYPGAQCKHDDAECCAANGCSLVRNFIGVMRDALYANMYRPFVAADLLTPFLGDIRQLYYSLSTEQIMQLEKIYSVVSYVSAESEDVSRSKLTEAYRKDEMETIRAKIKEFNEIVGHAFPHRVNTFQKIYD